jgi:hypothetical protein
MNLTIQLTDKWDARKGGRYFLVATLVQGCYFEAEAFSRTAAIRNLKRAIRRGEEIE